MRHNKTLVYVCAIVLAAAVVVAAALAPQLVFSAEDEKLFAETHPTPVTTGRLQNTLQNADAPASGPSSSGPVSLPVSMPEPSEPAWNENAAAPPPEEHLGDAAFDLPAVRMLYNYEEQQSDPDLETTYTSQQSQAEMDVLLPRSREYVARLADYGIISYEMVDWLNVNLYESPTINFTYGYDNRGYEFFTTNFGIGIDPPYYIAFHIDMATDLITYCDMHIPPEAPYELYDYYEPLNAYLGYLGLNALTSWQAMPDRISEADRVLADEQGVRYAPTFVGLYSDKVRVAATFRWNLYEDANYLIFGVSSYMRSPYPF